MLLTIYNLPAKTRYNDVKSLILTKCGLEEVILDNLSLESNNSKKVTVGLAEEEDAAILVRKINGLFVDGQQLYVETIKKKAPSALMDLGGNQQQQPMLQQPYYQQQQSYQANYQLGYTEMPQGTQSMGVPPVSYGEMYGVSQNPSANYGYPQQMQYQQTPQQMMAQSMAGYDQGAPLGFGNQDKNPSLWFGQNDWSQFAGNASGGKEVSQQGRTSTRWESDSSSRPRRSSPARDSRRDRPSRFEPEVPQRDSGRDAPRRDFGRDAPPRDRDRDAPRDLGRDRDQGRDRNQGRDRDRDQRRDRGRDAPARDREREPLGRNAPFRESPVRNALLQEPQSRNALLREPPSRNALLREPAARNALLRDPLVRASGPPARNAPLRDNGRDTLYQRRSEPSRAPTKRRQSPPAPMYGGHDTGSSPHMRTLSHQRDGSKPFNKPQPKESNYVPPSKRPKTTGAFGKPFVKPAANIPAQKPDQNEKDMVRNTTWRFQLASQFAKEVMNNPKHKSDILPAKLLPELKRVIRSRLDELFGENYLVRMARMEEAYREKFPEKKDTELFDQAILQIKINEEAAEKAAADNPEGASKESKPQGAAKESKPQGASKEPKPQGASKEPKPHVASKEPVKPIPPLIQGLDTTKKIPSYPFGDKKISKVLKKENAQMFQDEDYLLSKMKENVQKALVSEIDEMCGAVIKDIEINFDPELEQFEERVRTTVMDDLKKMMKVNLAKRIMNIGPIMLRVFNVNKTVSRGKLATALAQFGITSLRKSERIPGLYFGTCDSYDDHDRLIAMEPILVDGATVTFKPFHLTGKEKPAKQNKAQNMPTVFHTDNFENDIKVKLKEAQKMRAEKNINRDLKKELKELQKETDEFNNANTDWDQPTEGNNEWQDDNGNPESATEADTQEPENCDDEDTNGNIKLESETQDNIDDNAQVADTDATDADNEIQTEDTEKNSNKSIDTCENGNVEQENTEVGNTDTTPDENKYEDFTTDVDLGSKNEEDSFKIDTETDLEAEKNLTEFNTEDLEDFRRNNIDEIDMADLDDDDLEDW